MKRNWLVAFALVIGAGCGSDSSPSTTNNGTDAGVDAAADVTTGGTCSSYQGWVTDAVRSLPRECNTATDCMVVERAGNCECAIAATIGGDIAALNTALSELDERSCKHPFACLANMSQCSYQTPFDNKELVVTCEQNTCGLVEVMACDTYVARKDGGIFSPSACTVDSDCALRDDLNPCGCDEAYQAAFPFVIENEVYTLIARNQGRCSFTCDTCPQVTEAFCDNGTCAAR